MRGIEKEVTKNIKAITNNGLFKEGQEDYSESQLFVESVWFK